MPPEGSAKELTSPSVHNTSLPPTGARTYEIVYKNIALFGYLHAAALYGLYLCFTEATWQTIVFAYISYVGATIGVTAGAHRLWSHKAFKAKLPLPVILMALLSLANQRATAWVRDHRTHHKHSDTDADPHNAARGFFYSHIGWLFVRKHPEVKRRGQLIDLSDLYANPVVMFQHKYATLILPLACFVLPTLIPALCWAESACTAWHVTVLRYVLNSHVFFLVNSAAHSFGNKPYDRYVLSAESRLVSMATFGEGFHNYHHVFPWDYRNAEHGNLFFNYTKLFIDLAAKLDWAYDLKTVPEHLITARSLRTGDGSRHITRETTR